MAYYADSQDDDLDYRFLDDFSDLSILYEAGIDPSQMDSTTSRFVYEMFGMAPAPTNRPVPVIRNDDPWSDLTYGDIIDHYLWEKDYPANEGTVGMPNYSHLQRRGRNRSGVVSEYSRGGYPYVPPYGWTKVPLKVLGKYENDIWLTGQGERRDEKMSLPGEWAVSYHGTSRENAENIARVGYDRSKLRAMAFGEGFYSSPLPDVANGYSKPFNQRGKAYRILIMNRVNMDPDKTSIHNGDQYYVTVKKDFIRPTAFLYK